LVTELAPLLMFLRSKDLFRSLIIEEPEAHLHLEVQEKLARALARLVNAGLPVWLTTHGDSFFQQFSNLIKASSLKPSELRALGIGSTQTTDERRVYCVTMR
jgi:predicted ATPase